MEEVVSPWARKASSAKPVMDSFWLAQVAQVAAGAVSVNGAIRRDEPLTADDRLFGRYLLLRRGKKQYHLVICS